MPFAEGAICSGKIGDLAGCGHHGRGGSIVQNVTDFRNYPIFFAEPTDFKWCFSLCKAGWAFVCRFHHATPEHGSAGTRPIRPE